MAKLTKYRIFYTDVDDLEYRIDLKYEAWAGAITELTGSGNNINIEYNNEKFAAVNGSGISFSFLNDGNLSAEDFFIVGIYDIQIVVEAYNATHAVWAIVWSGYVNTEVFNEDYSYSLGVINITGNDGISVLDKVKYFSTLSTEGLVEQPWALGAETTINIIKECISTLDVTRVYTIVDIKGASDAFAAFSIDLANYVDEDFESFSKKQVLESLLKSSCLSLYTFGSAIWIIDHSIMAVSSNPTYLAYDNDMVAIPGENGTLTKNWDISDALRYIYFINANQNIDIRGGYSTITLNYSYYPNPKKIITNTPKEYNYTLTSWNNIERTDLAGGAADIGGYHYASVTDIGDNNLVDSYMLMTEYLGEESDDAYDQKVIDIAAGGVNGMKCFMLYGCFTGTGTDIAMTFEGGYIPKSTDTINIGFQFLLNAQRYGFEAVVNYVEITVMVKIGSYYGTCTNAGSNIIDSWSLTPQFATILPLTPGESVDDRYYNAVNQWSDASFTINLNASGVTGGICEVSFTRGMKAQQTLITASPTTPLNTTDTNIFLKDFVLGINGSDIEERDTETKTESDIDFKNKFKFEIDSGSGRDGGVLDVAPFIDSSTEHETSFDRNSFTDPGSLEKILMKAYVNNYSQVSRIINCDLKTTRNVLRNISDIASASVTVPLDINDVLTPISILRDTDNLTGYFLFTAGNINLIEKIISGSFIQIFDANSTIT